MLFKKYLKNKRILKRIHNDLLNNDQLYEKFKKGEISWEEFQRYENELWSLSDQLSEKYKYSIKDEDDLIEFLEGEESEFIEQMKKIYNLGKKLWDDFKLQVIFKSTLFGKNNFYCFFDNRNCLKPKDYSTIKSYLDIYYSCDLRI